MTKTTKTGRIALIGCGNLGSALLRGFREKLGVDDSRLVVCEREPGRSTTLVPGFEGKSTADPAEAIAGADVVIIAVKPKDVLPMLISIRAALELAKPPPLVVSVAAGVRLPEIREAAGPAPRLVRVMPNLPCMIGEGMSGIYGSEQVDVDAVAELFRSVGETVVVPQESDLDAVTALGAGAPAFIFQIIEALADGGVKMGLTRETALRMSAQMTYGSAAMLLRTSEHPAALKDMVASPGGTTIAGLHVLEKAGIRGALISAVEAATMRAAEVRKTKGGS